MSHPQLEYIRSLRESASPEDFVALIDKLAKQRLNDVEVRIEAAFANDRVGNEKNAVKHYDAAWELGVPKEIEQEFLVGYGSTLRNVGRTEEAVEVLRTAADAYPTSAPIKVFFALTLHDCGDDRTAFALLMEALVMSMDNPADIKAYGPALKGYLQDMM